MSDPSTTKACAFSAQDDRIEGLTYRSFINQQIHSVQSVEALAEIFDFVAGLVQRVPKKMNEVKSDLQNSTARLWNLEGSATCVN